MSSIPSLFPIPHVQKSFDEKGQPTDPRFDQRLPRFLGELEWYATALAVQRGQGTPY
jgi:hypothetical protein